jgi:3',5'-cyclic AMP phosphodiesterase CpdA
VAACILHVSDLHVGRREDPEPIAALGELAARIAPDVLVATGDLAHRGRRGQLERAAELLRGLGLPLLAVPGNHDLPYTLPARFSRTYAEWQRTFGSTEPAFATDSLLVVGTSSARPWRQQGGALSSRQLEDVEGRLRAAPAGVFRVVALHHHLAAPPWRARRKRPLRHRDEILRRLADAGAELVLGGHVHQAAIVERREFEALEEGTRSSVVLATVPGLGRPRPRRRGEARGANVYEVDREALTATTYAWDGRAFAEVARRVFPRG